MAAHPPRGTGSGTSVAGSPSRCSTSANTSDRAPATAGHHRRQSGQVAASPEPPDHRLPRATSEEGAVFLVRKTLLRSRCYQSGPHRTDPTACRHPGWTVFEIPSTRSVSDLPSIIWVLPGHRAPGRRRVQAVPGFHPLPRRNPGGSPSCILPALVRWLVWSPGGEWNRQGCRRAGRAAGGRHGARAKRRRDVGGRLFRITQYRALRACLRES